MTRKRNVFIAKAAVVLGVIPVLIYAYEYGPDAGECGVPGENGTCTQSGCHLGTANSGQGSVTVTFPGGQTYAPGVRQHLVVTVADPAVTQRAWGFELAARTAADSTQQAGTFTSSDANTQLLCSTNPQQDTGTPVSFSSSGVQACPSGQPFWYIEHSLTGYNTTRGHTGSQGFAFDWTPPSSNVGNIVIYVAGNAANGDLTQSGDHIYTNTYTLTPQAAAPPTAIDSTLGIQSLAGSPNAAGQPVAPGSLVAIYGSSFASGATRTSSAPLATSIGDLSVAFNGTAAALVGVAPGLSIGGRTVDQITAVVPWGTSAGSTPAPVPVTVTRAGNTTSAVNVSVAATAPGILPLLTDSTGISRPQVYNRSDGTLAVPADFLFAMLKTRPASIANDTLMVWCTGLGAVATTPADGAAPSGMVATTSTPTVLVGGRQATVTFSGLTQYPGIYQITLTLDPNTPTGDAIPIQIQLNGTTTTDQVKIAVTN